MTEQNVRWSEYRFEGKLIKVRVDTVEIEGSGLRQREIVEHPGAVGIVPILPDGRVTLVRQYRPAVGRSILEIPAGTMEPGESPIECARRELAEETGLRGDEFRELVRFFVSPGWCTEELICFVAENVRPGEQAPEDDEQIEVDVIDLDSIPNLIRRGEICDAKTIVSLSASFGLKIRTE